MQAFVDQPCSRCGSPRKISKKWKEKVTTFTGTITVDCAQIICTNKDCQKAFDQNLEEETRKKEALLLKKPIISTHKRA